MSLGLSSLIFLVPVARHGERTISRLESIHGIPFAVVHSETQITEKLAHADIYLQEPVIAKQLTLKLAFRPGNAQKIEVGIRENSFWLSYPKYEVYTAIEPTTALVTKEITIPLSDKLQEADRSIDVMFFTTTATTLPGESEAERDQTHWQLQTLTAQVRLSPPSWPEVKDYLKSIKNRERAL